MKGNLKLDHTVKANANQEEKVGFIAHKKNCPNYQQYYCEMCETEEKHNHISMTIISIIKWYTQKWEGWLEGLRKPSKSAEDKLNEYK